MARAEGGHSRCVFLHPVTLLHSVNDLQRRHLCIEVVGILSMCLRCDMLLLDPGFVFTVTLEGDSLTRRSSRPLDPCLCKGPQTAPCLLRKPGSASASGASTAQSSQIPSLWAPKASRLVPARARSHPQGRSGAATVPLRVPTWAVGAHPPRSRTL